MRKFVLICNRTGRVLGASSDLKHFNGPPCLLAKYLDQAEGRMNRTYSELPFADGGNGLDGYYCYASKVEQIESVERDCEPVCFVRVTD